MEDRVQKRGLVDAMLNIPYDYEQLYLSFSDRLEVPSLPTTDN